MTNTLKKPSPSLIWGLSAMFYFYEFMLQVSPSVMAPELMHSFSIDATGLGDLASVYFYVYAIMQIPAGMLLDRLGTKKLLTIACVTCSIGTILFSFANTLLLAELGRGFTGLGSAFAVIGCMSIAARWFPLKKFALLAGLMVTIGMTGAIFGQAPLALLVETFGWRVTLLVLGALGLILACFIYKIVEDNPKASQQKGANSQRLFAGLKVIVKNKQSWLSAIYGGLMYAPTIAFTALWGVPALMRVHGLSKTSAAFTVSLIFFGWAIGSPVFGWISDRIARRKTPMIIACIGSFITLSIAIYANLPPVMIGLLLFLYGFFSSGFILAFSIVREINPHEHSATSIGLTNMLNMIGGAIAQPVIGLCLDAMWLGGTHSGIRIYSAADYRISLALLPACIAAAFILLPFIKETFCKYKN